MVNILLWLGKTHTLNHLHGAVFSILFPSFARSTVLVMADCSRWLKKMVTSSFVLFQTTKCLLDVEKKNATETP